MIRGNLRILIIRNEFKEFKNFNVLKNISAIMSLYSPHKLGFFADARATIELLEKFNFPFHSLKGVGERLSEEEVESGASATQTPEVYQTNLCKQPGKLQEEQMRRLSIWA